MGEGDDAREPVFGPERAVTADRAWPLGVGEVARCEEEGAEAAERCESEELGETERFANEAAAAERWEDEGGDARTLAPADVDRWVALGVDDAERLGGVGVAEARWEGAVGGAVGWPSIAIGGLSLDSPPRELSGKGGAAWTFDFGEVVEADLEAGREPGIQGVGDGGERRGDRRCLGWGDV
jgi:hypothetical protein